MTTNITKQPGKAAEDDTAVNQETDQFLRAQRVVEALNLAIPEGLPKLPPIPKNYVFRKRDRETVSIAMHSAFELMGGVPALMQWAAHNPDKFFPLYFQLHKSDTETGAGGMVIQFNSAIPQNKLDDVSVSEDGRVVTINSDSELPE